MDTSNVVIHVHICTHNDEVLIPFIIRHYGSFADKIFVYDDHSTDRTLELAAGCPIMEVSPAPWGPDKWLDADQGHFYEKQYKALSRGVADWVIMLDSDEFVVHRHMGIREYLQQQKDAGEKVLRCQGWNMFSEELPTGDGQIYDQVRLGQRTTLYSKVVVFDPSIDLVFGPGRHTSFYPREDGNVECRPRSSNGLKMLHYKYLSADFSIRNGYYMNDQRIAHEHVEREAAKREQSLRRWRGGVELLKAGELRDPMQSK